MRKRMEFDRGQHALTLQPVAQQRQRMPAERQAQARIVGDDVFTLIGRGQDRHRFADRRSTSSGGIRSIPLTSHKARRRCPEKLRQCARRGQGSMS